jgi:type VI protein secretion system component VasK
MTARRVIAIVLLAPAVILGLLVGYLGPGRVLGTSVLAWVLAIAYMVIVGGYFIWAYYRDRARQQAPPVNQAQCTNDEKTPDSVDAAGRHRSESTSRWRSVSFPVEVVVLVVALLGLALVVINR